MRGSIIHLRSAYKTSKMEEKKEMNIYDQKNQALINHKKNYNS